MKTIDAAAKHPSGRLSGMVTPAQIDTCKESFFKEAHQEARKLISSGRPSKSDSLRTLPSTAFNSASGRRSPSSSTTSPAVPQRPQKNRQRPFSAKNTSAVR